MDSQIAKLDLVCVRNSVIRRYRWTADLADHAEAQYRQFLHLLGTYPDRELVPWTEELDKFWHEHLLHTRKYEKDCNSLFGRFIHHEPMEGDRQRHGIKRTMELHKKEFGSSGFVSRALERIGLKKKQNESSSSDSGCCPVAIDSLVAHDGVGWHDSSGISHDAATSQPGCGSDSGASCGGGSDGGSSCGGGGCGGGGGD